MNLHPKVLRFANEMQNQLNINSENKSDWENFTNVVDIILEIEYHKAKLLFAIKEKDTVAIKEYIADTANCLLFLSNSFSLVEDDQTNSVVVEMRKNIFTHILSENATKHDKAFSKNINNETK